MPRTLTSDRRASAEQRVTVGHKSTFVNKDASCSEISEPMEITQQQKPQSHGGNLPCTLTKMVLIWKSCGLRDSHSRTSWKRESFGELQRLSLSRVYGEGEMKGQKAGVDWLRLHATTMSHMTGHICSKP